MAKFEIKDNHHQEINIRGFQPTLVTFKDCKDKFFSFFANDEKRETKNQDDDLVFEIYKDGEYLKARSGNYIGRFKVDNHDINIISRFSNMLLKRMLNFADDIYLNDTQIKVDVGKSSNVFEFVLFYMFVQSLERASLLGLPKSYTSVDYNKTTLKGKLDVNAFIKNNIPFMGKISSTSREQLHTQDIIDVLFVALNTKEES